jgi:hypothetical protein
MAPDKAILDGTANQATTVVYMQYLFKRKLLSGKQKGKGVLDHKSLECALEAIADLKVHQLAHEPHRFPTAADRT